MTQITNVSVLKKTSENSSVELEEKSQEGTLIKIWKNCPLKRKSLLTKLFNTMSILKDHLSIQHWRFFQLKNSSQKASI